MSSRLRVFQWLIRRVSPVARRRRLEHLKFLDLKPGERVVDLGGGCEIWQFVDTPLDITIVNLPGAGVRKPAVTHHQFHLVEGDATDLSNYADNHFDVVFSNSVIEHVGGDDRQAAFAREVRRLAPRYYVQTPSLWFPLEVHSGVPFWWALPLRVRKRLIARWRARLPAWAEMIEGTTVITRRKLRDYFPDATLITERFAGIPKSYAMVRTAGK